MTIESDLASIKIHLGRIADALEGLLAEHGFVPTGPTTVATGPTTVDANKKKKKKLKNEKVVGRTDDEAVEWDLPGIRALLHKLQEQENQAAVKSALKKFGASTLGQVDKKKFAQLATFIEKKLDE